MKKNRGWVGFVMVLAIFLLTAILLNGGLNQRDRRLTYAEMWE